MTIDIKPPQERRIEELMRSGRFHSIDELLDQALDTISLEHSTSDTAQDERKRRAKDAAAHIRELSKGLSLEGTSIKDLIEEGRM